MDLFWLALRGNLVSLMRSRFRRRVSTRRPGFLGVSMLVQRPRAFLQLPALICMPSGWSDSMLGFTRKSAAAWAAPGQRTEGLTARKRYRRQAAGTRAPILVDELDPIRGTKGR